MNQILIILSFVVLTSCAANEIPSNGLVERQGLTYEVNSQTPFTGTSVSHLDNGQSGFKAKKGFAVNSVTRHAVTVGDTLFSIASKYGLAVGTLARINHLNPPYVIKLGQIITVDSRFPGPAQPKATNISGSSTTIQSQSTKKPLVYNKDWQWKRPIEGQLSSKSNRTDVEQTFRQTFTSEGKPKDDITYFNGKKSGLELRYHENGQLKFKSNYKDGEQHGLQEWYRKNGQSGFKANWNDGRQHGLREDYYENGQLSSKSNWKDGRRHGLREDYYESGQLKWKLNYKDGEQDGLWESYFENGQLKSKSNWKDGERL